MSYPANETPQYGRAFESKKRARILRALAELGGEAGFAQLEATSKITGNLLAHHLNVLLELRVLERPVKGTYRLRYKTPLAFIFAPNTSPTAYVGLLGRRDGRAKPEPQVALELLEKEGIRPQQIYVTSTPEAIQDWKDLRPPYQWIPVYEEEIADIDLIRKRVQPLLESLLKQYVVILDCTSATKPATIAYYELANRYLTPLIYLYEPTKRLKWLRGKQELLRMIGLTSDLS